MSNGNDELLKNARNMDRDVEYSKTPNARRDRDATNTAIQKQWTPQVSAVQILEEDKTGNPIGIPCYYKSFHSFS
ncbi:hypothetical protein [Bacillus sp. V33-4]|uniref:hypothetical protein n=1 Tax=Bacillus sp. V33-4 TaxID=2054169 RepID=UPI000C7856C9|nr:hypothetical protein [Bacillus sp. V33-4]PLR85785.1 hypothetical protein CVD23_07550 [Bacillus sp. V33-4]